MTTQQAPVAPAPGFITRNFSRAQRTWMWCVLAAYFVWNLPGWLNIRSAMQLAKTKKCKIRGYSKFLYLYPIIPIGVILSLLSLAGVSTLSIGILYAIFGIFAVIVATEDIRGRNAWGAFGTVFGIIFLLFLIEAKGIDVWGGLQRGLGRLFPEVSPGFMLLHSIVYGALAALLIVRSSVSNHMKVHGNNFIAVTLEAQVDHPTDDWRLRGRKTDILERLWMGALELDLLSNFGTGDKTEQDNPGGERVEFRLPNVPGAAHVERYVLAALAAKDVEVAPSTKTA